jgi:hypothetical protein
MSILKKIRIKIMKKNLLIVALIALIAGNVNAVAKKLTGLEEAHFMNPSQEEGQGFSSEEEVFQGEGFPSGYGSGAQPIQTKPAVETKTVKNAVYTLKIVRKDVPSAGQSQVIELTNEEGKPLEGDVSKLKQYIAQHENQYFGIPVEQQKLLFDGNELKNEGLLSTFPSGATLYLEVIEKKGAEKQEAAQAEQKESPQKPAPSKSTSALTKSTLKKPISKMTSRELAALDGNKLTEDEMKELVMISLFSGLEANRSAARKVVDKMNKEQSSKVVDWEKVIKEQKAKRIEKLMVPMGAESAATKSPAKAIEKMTSKEMGALKYENLTSAQQELLFEIALFSGLEDKRSVARKVIDTYRASKGMEKLQWDKQLENIFAE